MSGLGFFTSTLCLGSLKELDDAWERFLNTLGFMDRTTDPHVRDGTRELAGDMGFMVREFKKTKFTRLEKMFTLIHMFGIIPLRESKIDVPDYEISVLMEYQNRACASRLTTFLTCGENLGVMTTGHVINTVNEENDFDLDPDPDIDLDAETCAEHHKTGDAHHHPRRVKSTSVTERLDELPMPAGFTLPACVKQADISQFAPERVNTVLLAVMLLREAFLEEACLRKIVNEKRCVIPTWAIVSEGIDVVMEILHAGRKRREQKLAFSAKRFEGTFLEADDDLVTVTPEWGCV